MTVYQFIVFTLLNLYPYMSGNNRACIERNQVQIASVLERGEKAYGVPPLVLLSVGFAETHLGCDAGEGGNWGAPISRFQRHRAGTPVQAAQALQASYRVCGTWLGAISRFRSGLCRIPRRLAHYPRNVVRLMTRISERTNQPLPIQD